MASRTTVTSRIEQSHLTVTTELYVTDCAECGIVFAFAAELERRRRRDAGTFYCPNGHKMVFGDDERARLERELEQAKADAAFWQREEGIERRRTAHERRRAAALKGHLTRAKRRAAAGLCPAAGCKRSFSSLHQHVSDCHPELLDTLDLEED